MLAPCERSDMQDIARNIHICPGMIARGGKGGDTVVYGEYIET